MRIVYFSPHPTHDIVSDVGYSTHQREMIAAFRSLGHEVFLVIIGGTTKGELPSITGNGKSSVWQPFKRLIPGIIWRTVKDFALMLHDRFVAGPRLEQAILTFKPDFVYERSEYCLEQGGLICKKYGIRHVYEVNSPCVEEWLEFEGGSLLTWYARRIEQRKFRNTTHACCVSSALVDFVSKNYGFDRNKILLTPNAVNAGSIENKTINPERLKARLKLPRTAKVIGFVGSIWPYHGVDLLIDSFFALCGKYDEVELLIVGDGISLKELIEKAQLSTYSDRVHFVGRVEHRQVFEYISVMDICVMAKSNWYGSPVKVFEYGALGKAVIAPNLQPLRDVIENGIDGLLVEPTTGSLIKAIERMIINDSERLTMANRFQSKVQSKFTWNAIAAEIVAFVQK